MPPTQGQSRDKIGHLVAKYQKMPKEDRVRISEAGVVHQFLDPLLEALGWPIQDPQHYKYELFLTGGRPDMTLIPDRGGTTFVEAKRFDAIVPRAARLTCTRPEFAGLWQQVMGEPWDESKGAAGPAARQALRDELDALVAHLYGLSRHDFAHILGTFPLVFPDNDDGQRKKEAVLGVYDGLAATVKGWAT